MIDKTCNVIMSVYREQADGSDSFVQSLEKNAREGMYQAIYLLSDGVKAGLEVHRSGTGFCLRPGSSEPLEIQAGTELLRFECYRADIPDPQQAAGSARPVLQQMFTTSETTAVLRLDRVDFPPGAVAYRHTHPGGGLRYLTKGSLALDASGETHQYSAGEAWFEDANSPVLATADNTQDSQFVRMMLLPKRYEGKSTFTHLNKEDETKPRLQTNIRFFDETISLI